MSESLVVIRTFPDLTYADEAQVELLAAGIHSLLFTGEASEPPASADAGQGIGLAVHRRDVEIAEAVLASRSEPR